MNALRVLVADDDEDLRGLLCFFLEKQGCEVVQVEDGNAALTAGLEQRFDLVVTDVMMPGLDGYHVVQKLSESLGARCPKIVIMTSRDTGKEAGLAAYSGAAMTIQKPFKLSDFREKIARLFDQLARGEEKSSGV